MVKTYVLQEDLEDTTSLVVDSSRDTLDTTSASQSTDGWLGDTLDVVAKNLAVAFSSTPNSRKPISIAKSNNRER